MIASGTKIPLQLQRQRQNRHNKLMSMINSYQLTKQQKNKLQKIKSHTMMEINLRFLRSQPNRNYKFPKISKSLVIQNSDDQDQYSRDIQEINQDKQLKEELQQNLFIKNKTKRRPAESFIYDLKSQNIPKQKKQSKADLKDSINSFVNKFSSLEQSRRVHSLGNQKSHEKQKDDYIVRKHSPIKHSNQRYAKSPLANNQSQSAKSLKVLKPFSQTRKSSKNYLILQHTMQKSPQYNKHSKNLLIQSKKLKLPQIITSSSSTNSRSMKKLTTIHEKLKTEKLYQDQDNIQVAIGKKLVTETTDSGKKAMRGVQKYLKELQTQKQLLNHPSRMIKKESNQSERKKNIGLFKTTKNSLKGEIDKQTY